MVKALVTLAGVLTNWLDLFLKKTVELYAIAPFLNAAMTF